MRKTSRLYTLVAAALLSAPAAEAQTVVARVTAAETGAAVQGALVYLLGGGGGTVASRLSDDAGRTLFVGLAPGTYRVRAEMIGLAAAESSPFEVETGQSVPVDVSMVSAPVALDDIEVAADERCRVRPEEGLAVARVWDEARKALAVAALTDREGLYRYETMRYERDVARDTRAVLSEARERQEGYMRTPFESLPAEDLAADGFVQDTESGTMYYAPDAHVLLSDAFLDTHCFRLERGRDRAEGLLGLGFEPTGRRAGVVDIAGTLWLDPGTSELSWLDYRYAHLQERLDPDVISSDLGGHVRFRRMPEGTWIVPEWWIRMPRIGRGFGADGVPRQRLVGYRQTGGLVVGVREGGRSLGAVQTGGIEGVVLDSLGVRPLPMARVGLAFSNQQVFTDTQGRFRITGLLEGTYPVRVTHPDLEAAGYEPEPFEQAVFQGEMAYVEHRVPSVGEALMAHCRDRPLAADAGVVAGTVSDATGRRPVAGATVRVDWVRARIANAMTPEAELVGIDRPGLWTTTDVRGFYRLCGVPIGHQFVLRAEQGDLGSRPDSLRIPENVDGIVHALALDARRR